MKVSGLSNQWKTRDGLFDSFAAGLNEESDPMLLERCRAVHQLLETLESIDGPDLWVGTSHSLMHFLLQDAKHQFDEVRCFVQVYAYEMSDDPPQCAYRIGFSMNGADWDDTDLSDPLEAAQLIKRLLGFAGDQA